MGQVPTQRKGRDLSYGLQGCVLGGSYVQSTHQEGSQEEGSNLTA